MPLSDINAASDELISALGELHSPELTSAMVKLLRARETHSEKILAEIKELREDTYRILNDGFPDGDLSGHRVAHLAWIKRETIKAERWETIKSKTLQGLIWLAIIQIGRILWQELSRMLPKM